MRELYKEYLWVRLRLFVLLVKVGLVVGGIISLCLLIMAFFQRASFGGTLIFFLSMVVGIPLMITLGCVVVSIPANIRFRQLLEQQLVSVESETELQKELTQRRMLEGARGYMPPLCLTENWLIVSGIAAVHRGFVERIQFKTDKNSKVNHTLVTCHLKQDLRQLVVIRVHSSMSSKAVKEIRKWYDQGRTLETDNGKKT